MKHLPVTLAVCVGIVVGVFAGRLQIFSSVEGGGGAPANRPVSEQGAIGDQAEMAANGQPSRQSSVDLKPLNYESLVSELGRLDSAKSMDASSLRARADLQDRLKVSDLPAMVAALANSPATDQDRSVGLIFRAYAEENPQAAWRLALSIQNLNVRRGALNAVMSAVASKNAEMALGVLQEVKEANIRRDLRNVVLGTLAANDPARAFALATQSDSDEDFSLSSVLSQWARKDPQAAMAAVAKLKGKQAELARNALVSALAWKDPKAAWDYASQLAVPEDGNFWRDPRLQVMHQWAQTDPAAALGAALAIQDSEVRNNLVANAVGAWAASNFPAALAYAVKVQDADTRGRILQNLAGNSNSDHPQMFAALMEHAPAGSGFQMAMGNLINQWAQDNPREAAAAMLQLPPSQSVAHLSSRVVSAWVSSGAEKMEIFNWVCTLPEGQIRSSSVSALFGSWANEDPSGALRALSALDPKEKSGALAGIANGWSRTSPTEAVAWAAALPSGNERDNALRGVLQRWSQSSPADVAAYVGRMPEAERITVMGTFMGSWASKDTASAAAWLQNQPVGKPKDAGLQSLANQIAREDPEAALAWTVSISDPGVRASQTEKIARDWLSLDPANARKWIHQTQLSPELRQKLLK